MKGIPAFVSYDVDWAHVKRRFRVDDDHHDYTADLVETHATVAWSAMEDGFTFRSDRERTSQTVYAVLGRERNGRFHRR